MSYDLMIGVKVAGYRNKTIVIAEPRRSNPTYNIREMLWACMGWKFDQGRWYNCEEVYPKIVHGLKELKNNEVEYMKYNAPNGWGTTESAKEDLESLIECINMASEENDLPLKHLYMRW